MGGKGRCLRMVMGTFGDSYDIQHLYKRLGLQHCSFQGLVAGKVLVLIPDRVGPGTLWCLEKASSYRSLPIRKKPCTLFLGILEASWAKTVSSRHS